MIISQPCVVSLCRDRLVETFEFPIYYVRAPDEMGNIIMIYRFNGLWPSIRALMEWIKENWVCDPKVRFFKRSFFTTYFSSK